ncbi:hypothetical protein HYPSUDRAFT_467160 [Hypholoma sublateritium FD-334 SS-4]|uniref:Uncharacterized protein n=1 Tax=Hypholoma sublateritium (strain FD-334 SS-4) TaxID=945553 RepID=A0A0D2NZZ5_HYPSF|nr:hypothetical protein HYPSUDRAFT_467160 [Hypholoma sublateritium FD-334 SS-4]
MFFLFMCGSVRAGAYLFFVHAFQRPDPVLIFRLLVHVSLFYSTPRFLLFLYTHSRGIYPALSQMYGRTSLSAICPYMRARTPRFSLAERFRCMCASHRVRRIAAHLCDVFIRASMIRSPLQLARRMLTSSSSFSNCSAYPEQDALFALRRRRNRPWSALRRALSLLGALPLASLNTDWERSRKLYRANI